MKLYAIAATITEDGVTHQLPTFYLNPNVQGITSEKMAEKIALAIVDPLPVPGRMVYVTAFEVETQLQTEAV